MNDEDVAEDREPGPEPEAKVLDSMPDADEKGMLFATEGASLITCRDGQNRLLMLSICAAFRAD